MRSLLIAISLFLLLAWIAGLLPASFSPVDARHEPIAEALPVAIWRRTNRGWERADQWPSFHSRPAKVAPAPPIFHPLVLTGVMLFSSLIALAAFDPAERC